MKINWKKLLICLAIPLAVGGLGALLGDLEDRGAENTPYKLLPIYKVEPNPDQPRQDFDEEELQQLADSIAVHGVIQPLTVRELPSGYYQIIAGERRWRAARIAEMREIPAVIIEADDKKVMELALIENLQRQDLNPVEEAMGYQTLMEEYGLTQEDAAKQVGKSRPAVANALRLLNLPEKVLEMVGPDRFLYGTDFPIFRMKARRVVENGFYINEIPMNSLGDVSGDPHMREIPYPEADKISFFIYEEILSCKRACEKLGMTKEDVNKIFYANSARIFGVK